MSLFDSLLDLPDDHLWAPHTCHRMGVPQHVRGMLTEQTADYLLNLREEIEQLLSAYTEIISEAENYKISIGARLEIRADATIAEDEYAYPFLSMKYIDMRNPPAEIFALIEEVNTARAEFYKVIGVLAHRLRALDGLERHIEMDVTVQTLQPALDAQGHYPITGEDAFHIEYATQHLFHDPHLDEASGEVLDEDLGEYPWDQIATPTPLWQEPEDDFDENTEE